MKTSEIRFQPSKRVTSYPLCPDPITYLEFDEVGAEIGRALDYFNVPEREKQEVLGAIVARKAEVINPSR